MKNAIVSFLITVGFIGFAVLAGAFPIVGAVTVGLVLVLGLWGLIYTLIFE